MRLSPLHPFKSDIYLKFTTSWSGHSGLVSMVGTIIKSYFFEYLKNPGSVSDSLVYEPEKATVVATYKHLVVGVAILSSPIETYITYLAVRAGWDNSQIATYVSSTLACPNNNNTGTGRCCTILYSLIQTRISRYMYPLTIPPWYALRNPYGYLN